MEQATLSQLGFYKPGQGRGLLDAADNRFLLKLLVNKELRVRYRGSFLGMAWSYVKPTVQFFVFYFAVGVFLRMNQAVPNFAVYLFSGIIAINLFNEAFGNATRAVVGNAALVKKIYLPRQLFSLASVWVAIIHFIPQLVVLIIAAFAMGWRPAPINLAAGLLGFLILITLSIGLGLLFGAMNVILRDSENIVDLIAMVASWASPVLYHWQNVQAVVPEWGWVLYRLNPLTPVVELFHFFFWAPSASVPDYAWPPGLWTFSGIAVITSLVILVIGEQVFRRLDGRFAQEL